MVQSIVTAPTDQSCIRLQQIEAKPGVKMEIEVADAFLAPADSTVPEDQRGSHEDQRGNRSPTERVHIVRNP